MKLHQRLCGKIPIREKVCISPKTGQGNKAHFSLLWAMMLTFKWLSLSLSDAVKCDS